MDDETLIRKLRRDSGSPPPAPEYEWQVVQARIDTTPEPRYFQNILWLGGGLTLAMVGIAVVLLLPTGGQKAPMGDFTSDDSAVVLERLLVQEQWAVRPVVVESGARWLALMDGIQD